MRIALSHLLTVILVAISTCAYANQELKPEPPERNRVYLMQPAGGIMALDITSGQAQWKSNQGDQPLFVAEGVLVALVEFVGRGMELALLDPRSGEPLAGTTGRNSVPLPRGVSVMIDQSLERTFRYSVSESGGMVLVNWEYIQRDVSGVAPSDGSPFVQHESGVFRFHKHAFEALQVAAVPSEDNDWPMELDEFLEAGQVRQKPWRSGRVFAIIQQQYNPNKLILKRWQAGSGQALKDRVLFEGRAIATLPSCNKHHAVVAVKADNHTTDAPYLLSYFDLDSGELRMQLPSRRSAGPFCLFGQRLLRLSQPILHRVDGAMVRRPLELEARGLDTGNEVWRHAIRDTAFRGLAPPRR